MSSSVPGVERILFTEEQIDHRIRELAAQISVDYRGKTLKLIAVLKGSVFFLTDVLKRLTIPVAVDFLQVRSYAGTGSTGNIQLVHDLSMDIEGKDVLLFEDVVDTGLTLRRILELLASRHPRSLKIAALLKKDLRENADIPIDFLGFAIGPEFVVGYGLDLDERFRNLPYVAVWDPTR